MNCSAIFMVTIILGLVVGGRTAKGKDDGFLTLAFFWLGMGSACIGILSVPSFRDSPVNLIAGVAYPLAFYSGINFGKSIFK